MLIPTGTLFAMGEVAKAGNYVYYYNYYVTADYYPDYFPINSYFYNLDPEKDYAVCWRSGPDLRVQYIYYLSHCKELFLLKLYKLLYIAV